VLLLDREDVFQHAARRGIGVADVLDHLAVAVDRDPLGDQVLLDRFLQRLADPVFRMAAAGDDVRVEVGLAPELHDALGDLVGVRELRIGVLQELGGDRARVDAARHEIVVAIAQDAHELGRQRLVQQLDHLFLVRAVVLGDGALLDMAPRLLAQRLHVGELRGSLSLGLLLRLRHRTHADLL
jgi:hypothetical protein